VSASTTVDEDEVTLLDVELDGTATSYTIPGATTAGWSTYQDILITVDGGEDAWAFTGDLAAPGSAVFTVVPGDAIVLNPGEGAEWLITVTLNDYSLEADGQSTTNVTAFVEDQELTPCDDGTDVIFWAEPDGYVSIDPTIAQTTAGEAVTTLTVGTTPGDVEIHAAALDAEGYAVLTLEASVHITVGPGEYPEIDWTPAESMVELLVRQTGIEVGNLRWSITGYFGPPVTYGTVPENAIQTYPLMGGTPDALESGVGYRVVLVDAVGDTTSYEFTR